MNNNEVMMDIFNKDIAEGDACIPYKWLLKSTKHMVGYTTEDNVKIKRSIAARTRRFLNSSVAGRIRSELTKALADGRNRTFKQILNDKK